MRRTLRQLIEALFRVLFTYDCVGEEHIPQSGPAVVAANHPSYLDPLLLSLQVERPIRFMAWDALFRVPLLGGLLRAFGTFPVDVRRGRGGAAFDRARALLEQGEVIGIFPEGKRSRTGWMEPTLREGAARLSFATGAPLVPATIAGAFRAWPHYQALPSPARIRVRFHPAVDPAAYRHLPEDDAVAAMLRELRRRVERSLLPGVKADLRLNVLWRLPSAWPRFTESLPVLALALAVFWKTREIRDVLPAYAYLGYLLLDHFLIPQRRLVKWIRNASPVLFAFGYGPTAFERLGLPPVPAGEALAAVLLGGLFPYLYEHAPRAFGAVQGVVFSLYLSLSAQYLWPTGLGPHVAAPLFLAAYAWEGRTVFWRYAVPVLLAYVAHVPLGMGGGGELVPHATVALVAWIAVSLLAGRRRQESEDEPAPGLGLNL